LRRLLSPCRWS